MSEPHQATGVLVLGLDPGSFHTGYGFVERRGSTLRAVAHGRISCPRTAPLAERLAQLNRELAQLLARFAPDAAALESPFHGRNSRSLIVLAQARGALLAALAQHRIATREYSPAEVKTAVTGSGRADKTQVGRMVRLLLALPGGPLSEDSSDALAVAICFAQRRRMEERIASAAG